MDHLFCELTRARGACAAAALLFVSALAPGAANAATQVACNPTRITVRASDANTFTTSTTFVTLAGAGRKFVQGGSKPSCVILRFEAYVATSANTAISVSASIDGSTINPSETQLAYNSNVFLPSAWTFVIPKVAPGEHQIAFKFRSNNGNSVSVGRTNLIINHAP